jgi:hypothetical protein
MFDSELAITVNVTELGIVCSLSSGRIVANPDIDTRLGVTSGWPVIRPSG